MTWLVAVSIGIVTVFGLVLYAVMSAGASLRDDEDRLRPKPDWWDEERRP
jgi:hypothetical protein